MLSMLRERGWSVEVLCGDRVDGRAEGWSGGTPREAGGVIVRHVEHRGIRMRVVATTAAGAIADGRLAALPLLLEAELARQGYDIMLASGGGWCGRAVLKVARRAGVASAFWLRNTLYQRRDIFDDVAGVMVPSAHTARHYLRTLGLRTDIVFSIVDRERVKCPVRQPRYVTFVSPLPEKGALFVARLVSEIGRQRPDIDVMIVQGRGDAACLEASGLEVLRLPNVRWVPRVEDPRTYLAVTRLLIFPSVWEEPLGRTAIEAMINGIPVIASDRGGLSEAVGIGGVVLPLPERLTPENPALATVAEVQPWLDEITRIWDDEDEYRMLSRRAMASSGRFDAATLANRADALLRQWSEMPITPKLGPDPLVAGGYPGSVDELRAAYAEGLAGSETLLA
jgi:glycosyltransferase involved in cell wall biosynthesis